MTRYICFDEESPFPVIRDDFLGTGAAISGPLLFRLAIQDTNVKIKSTSGRAGQGWGVEIFRQQILFENHVNYVFLCLLIQVAVQSMVTDTYKRQICSTGRRIVRDECLSQELHSWSLHQHVLYVHLQGDME